MIKNKDLSNVQKDTKIDKINKRSKLVSKFVNGYPTNTLENSEFVQKNGRSVDQSFDTSYQLRSIKG